MAVLVSVPATTANLGPGFDCLGAALNLYNRFRFEALPAGQLAIAAVGPEAEKVSREADNLVVQCFERVYRELGQPAPGLKLDVELAVPLARGLGSSATAIVAGLVGANALAGNPLSREHIRDLATEIEGHPDNVVPAYLGGAVLAATDPEGGWVTADLNWNPEVVPVLAIPDFELSTEAARSVLPQDYSRADAIFNTAHCALVIRALETGNPSWLRAALQDRIHQPYRQSLISGYAEVEAAALAAGAHAMVISGAGPTLLALASPETAAAVAAAMDETWRGLGINPMVKVLAIAGGTTVETVA